MKTIMFALVALLPATVLAMPQQPPPATAADDADVDANTAVGNRGRDPTSPVNRGMLAPNDEL